MTLDVEIREGKGRVGVWPLSGQDGSRESNRLFRKPAFQIKGPTFAAVLLNPTIRWAATISAVTRYRGFMRVLGALSQIRYFRDAYCNAALARDSFFRFPATDSYWGFYTYTGLLYESSLHHVFAAIQDIDYQVLDCGANYGYWSVILSGAAYGRRNVIAIEASERTFDFLQSNCALNGHRFQCIHRAVSGRSGRPLIFECRSHESAHICAGVSGGDARYCEETRSVSLDDLCGMLQPHPERLVIKLDIEGHEIEALIAAKCVQTRDVLIIIEDHGLDPSSLNTAYLLGLRSFAVYWVDDVGRSVRVKDMVDVNRIKKPRNYGYNFFAVTRDGEFHRCLTQNLTSGPALMDFQKRKHP